MLEQQINGTENRPNPLAILDIKPARILSANALGSTRMAWATMREGESQPIALTIDGRQAGLPEGKIEILSEEIHDPWDKKHMRAPGMTP